MTNKLARNFRHCIAARHSSLDARIATVQAHPHVWSDMRSDVVLNEKGEAVAINVEWIFDEGYTAAAIEGMDANGDGIYTSVELHPVVTENIAALKEFRYFVQAKAAGKDIRIRRCDRISAAHQRPGPAADDLRGAV
jgi:ABC-type uncharacterized transport system substrate-binding protein